MDAYMAAFAIQQGAELVTFDKGFRKFEKAGWRCGCWNDGLDVAQLCKL